MKIYKFRDAWFPLLVIGVALFSAFSAKNSVFTANRWEIFGVEQNTMNGEPYPNSAEEVYSARISDNFADQVNSFSQAVSDNLTDVDVYISTYNNNQFPTSVICSPDNQHICVATVQYFNSMPTEATLVDYNYGDYLLDD